MAEAALVAVEHAGAVFEDHAFSEVLARALESLPARQREVIVLRELEGCSYKEIATITSIPIGTVMSTLSRARQQLHFALTNPSRQEATYGL